jgi:putative acetyltransferase
MKIRPEQRGEEQVIHDLTQTAFATMPFSDGTEGPIIDALRKDGDLTLSLVAVEEDRIVGHIAFSPVTIDGRHDGWFGLGPVAVLPELQRRGIGKALIAAGLELLRQRDASGCALIGDPAYYKRSGFVSNGALLYGDLDKALVQFMVFRGLEPIGRLRFAPGFGPE